MTEQQPIYAVVEVSARPQVGTGFDETAAQIFQDPCVVDHYLISGSYDFLLIIKAKNLHEVANFISHKLSHLDNITSTETHFVLKKYKEKGEILAQVGGADRLPVSA